MRNILALGTRASSIAGDIDLLFLAVTLVAVFFSAAIAAAIIFFAVRYRRGHKVDRSRAPQHNTFIEVTWTVIPLGIALGLFAWASILYVKIAEVPAGAMEIYVVGKQWMWKMQHPEGRWENNELHVPAGRPIVLTMTSEDVIHSFYVPAFRLKKDVIPGQYTRLWFTPTKPGVYHLFCAEFCGTLHSSMTGTITVMEPADYEQWLRAGGVSESMAAAGERLFRQYGCSGCHAPGASVRAPLLDGIYNQPVPVWFPKQGVKLEETPVSTVVADTSYIHDSIVLPGKAVVAGYRNIMPTYKNRLSEQDILKLVAYIKSLGTARQPGSQGTQREPLSSLTAEDYKARTGFVPENIQEITGGGNAPSRNAPESGGAAAPGAGRGRERMPR